MKKQFTRLIGACCVSVFLLLISTTGAFAQYCASSASNTDPDFGEWITNVVFAGIDNPSGNTGYSDFTTEIGTVVPGVSYEFSGTLGNPGDYTEYITVYIDWDQSETWDAGEVYQIGSCGSDGCVITGNVDVPITATPGETRMRVVLRFNAASTDPCDQFLTFGEVEDYTINVQSGECTPPSLTYSVVNNCADDTYAISVTANDLGSSSSATIFHKRSDGVPIGNTGLNQFTTGVPLTFATAIPFGVTVRDSIVSGNPICTLIRNFAENICPAENDEICDAVSMACGDTLADMPFIGATESIADNCPGSGTLDVWYTFTSDGSEKYIFASSNDLVFSVYTGSSCSDTTTYIQCWDDPNTLTFTEAGTYYVRVRNWSATAGDFHTVWLECVPFDCLEELGDYGSPCDDGDPNTVNDALQEDCSCAGEPQLVNDEACGAIELFCGDDLSDQTFVGASQSVDDACGGSGTGDVWYKFVADGTQTYFIEETETDVVVSLYTGSDCGDLTQIGSCVDFGENFTVTDAGTYYFRIRPYGSATTYGVALSCTPFDCPGLGNFGGSCDDGNPNTVNDGITADCECVGYPPAANDELCSAATLNCNETVTQSYLGASPSPEGSCADGVTNDIWYQFTAEEGVSYQIDIVSTVDGVFNSYSDVEVLVGEAGADCNSELTEYVPCGIYLSIYADTVATYFIRAQPTGIQDELQIRLSCYELPDNPTCEDATPVVCGETYTGATSAAPQHDPNQPFCGTSAPSVFNTGVWFSYAPEADIVMNFDLTGSTFNTKLFLYSGACDALVCEAGDDNSGEGNTSFLSDTLYAGTTYYVYVTGSGNGRGDYVLNTSCIDLECSPTIASLTLVDANGTPLGGCVDLGADYYVEVTLAGGLDDGYNVSLNGGASVLIAPNGTGIVGPGVSPAPGNVSVVGSTNIQCAVQGTIDVSVCPPAYDVPCGAAMLTVDGGLSGPYSNVYAGVDEGELAPEATSCTTGWCDGPNLDNSIWFQIDVPIDVERISITSCDAGTTFDTQLAVYTASDCNDYSTFALLGANDDQVGGCSVASFASTLELCVEAGSTVYVQLDGYNGASGDAVLNVESIADATICQCVLPTINLESYPVCTVDSSSYSVDITIDDLGSSDYVNFTFTIAGVDSVINNVTESFTFAGLPLGNTLFATVELSDPACSDFGDLSVSVFQGSDACAPDCEGTLGGDVGPGSPCPGGTYDPNCNCVPTPANDECADAIALECSDYVVGYNVGASLNTGCDGDDRQTVWYSYTPESAGTVTLTTCNPETNFDTDLNVYTGSCDDLTCFSGFEGDGYVDGPSSCSYQSFAGAGSFEGVAGVTYYIAVTGYYPAGGFSAAVGNFGLSIEGSCAGSTLTGTVSNWNSDCGGRPATVKLYEPGTATMVASYNTTVAGDGTFSVDGVEVGTFDIIVKVAGYLAKGTQDVILASGDNNMALGTIKFGDFNGNNTVDIFDISTFSSAFGSQDGNPGYNELADYNCDGAVVLFDLSAINQTYAGGPVSGDVAPL